MPTTMTAAAALRALGVAEDTYGPTVNTARAPEAVDVLGDALAEALHPARAAALVVWNTPDEAVLAHSVARRLGVGVCRAVELEGVLSLDGALESGTPVALFATRWSGQRLAALRNLVHLSAGRPVAVAAILGSAELSAIDDLFTRSLFQSGEAAEFFS